MGLETTTSLGYNGFSNSIENDMHIGRKEDQWTYARNAVVNSPKNDLFAISNEQSNYLLHQVKYYNDERDENINIIGTVHIQAGEWAIFSTDETKSEIGHFNAETGVYTCVVNSDKLNFSKYHLITGVGRIDSKCRKRVYWDDGNNPSRVMDMDEVPWVQEKKRIEGTDCYETVYSDELDIERLRLAQLAPPMVFEMQRGNTGGQLPNGAYFVAGAYVVDGQRVTSYSLPSNTVYIYSHENLAGSLEITVSDAAQDYFDEFELVLVQYTNMNPVAYRVGVYSTRQEKIYLDKVDIQLEMVSLGDVIRNQPVVEKTDAMYRNGEYILRVGTTEKLDFNYQPLANKIQVEWVSVQYPSDYYKNGGTNVGYMRDEIYSFFIRWVYNTGDRSRAYHIPGRVYDDNHDSGCIINNEFDDTFNSAFVENQDQIGEKMPDGVGVINAYGKMGYWQSSEKYDDDKHEVWGTLCGKNIRHHKFPDNNKAPFISDGKINILGVRFKGIEWPVDNQGNKIENIIGYEIYRGNRDGNKTVLAKGIFKNMLSYTDSNSEYLIQNFPFNDSQQHNNYIDNLKNKDNVYSFYSPDLMFRHPYLSAKSIKVDGLMVGKARQKFVVPKGTPKQKLVEIGSLAVSFLLGLGYSVLQTRGKVYTTTTYPNIDFGGTTGGVGAGVVELQFSTGHTGFSAIEAFKQSGSVKGAQAANNKVRDLLENGTMSLVMIQSGIDPKATSRAAEYVSDLAAGVVGGRSGPTEVQREDTAWSTLPKIIRGAVGLPLFFYYVADGVDKFLDIIYNILPYRDHTLLTIAYGMFESLVTTNEDMVSIEEQGYLQGNLQDFSNSTINNLWRSHAVVLQTKSELQPKDIYGSREFKTDPKENTDHSQEINRLKIWENLQSEGKKQQFVYGALKQRLSNQYGQVNAIQMVPICNKNYKDSVSDILFGGDTFIGRYTFKDTMMFFNQWLTNEPDGTGFDYGMHMNVPGVKYHANFNKFQISQLLNKYTSSTETGKDTEQFSIDLWESKTDEEGNEIGGCDCDNQDNWKANCKDDKGKAMSLRKKYCQKSIEYNYLKFALEYSKSRLCVDHTRSHKNKKPDSAGCNNLTHNDAEPEEEWHYYVADTTQIINYKDVTYKNKVYLKLTDKDNNVSYNEYSSLKECIESLTTYINYNLGKVTWPDDLSIGKDYYQVYNSVWYTITGNNVPAQFNIWDKISKLEYYTEDNFDIETGSPIDQDTLGPWRYVFVYNDISNYVYDSIKDHNNMFDIPEKKEANTFDVYIDFLYENDLTSFFEDAARQFNITDEVIPTEEYETLTSEEIDKRNLQKYIIEYTRYLINAFNVFKSKFYNVGELDDAFNISNNIKYENLSPNDKESIIEFFLKHHYIDNSNTNILFEPRYPGEKEAQRKLDRYEKGKGKYYKKIKQIDDDLNAIQDEINSVDSDYMNYKLGGKQDNDDSWSTVLNNLGGAGNPNLWAENKYNNNGNLISTLKSIGFGQFEKKNAFIFLGCATVTDYFVESDYNIDFRDYGDNKGERFYDHLSYTNIDEMFEYDSLTKGNFMKYDMSFSVVKNPYQYIPWAITQDIDYDPEISEKCYVYKPNRIIYSLPQKIEGKKDNWRIFLPMNYKEFTSRPTSVKQYGKYAALITFQSESPAYFEAFDQLSTDAGIKINVGDGGLLSSPTAHMSSAEAANEYGSCQDRLSVINTPMGVYYISQNQGKIFSANYGEGLKETSLIQLNSWLYRYMPYQLLQDKNVFINEPFELIDNPVAGIGCQSIYDNNTHMIYFCKKDYRLKEEFRNVTLYKGNGKFQNTETDSIFELGDNLYFDDASWTLSYQPMSKTGSFISWHDWHPNLTLPTKDTFMTIKGAGIWMHNDRCDSFCNFYGKDYPYEVEYEILGDNMSVETLRNVYYVMEAYIYDENCNDRFHVLDENFDEAIVYNSEQCSGLLRLKIKPKNDPLSELEYPKINDSSIDILVSKEEQIYRFNQFFDITRDRGEFPHISDNGAESYSEKTIFKTEVNGYIRQLNEENLNYDKEETEHKKFRHFKETIVLRKKVSGNKNLVLSIGLMKRLNSFR